MRCRDPMQSCPDLSSVGSIAAARRRIIGAYQLYDLPCRIFHCLAAGDQIAVAQSYLAPRREPVEAPGWVFHKILSFDVDLACEGNAARTGSGVLGIVDCRQLLDNPNGIIVDYELQWAQHPHPALRGLVQAIADRLLEHCDIDNTVRRC